MLAARAYDAICHEHIEYYALEQIVWLADRVGFSIVDVRDPRQPQFTDHCFTGDYPIALPDQQESADRQLSLLTVGN